MKVSIIIPVVRKYRVVELVETIYENAGVPQQDYEILVDYDNDGIGCPQMVAGLVARAKHDWIMFLGDDTMPQPDFLKNAIAKAQELPGWGLVCLNDGLHNGALATHWLAHRKLADLNDGYFFHPDYYHCYCDQELTDIARENEVYLYAEGSIIRHDHPSINPKITGDQFYSRAAAKKEADYRTYYQRKRKRLAGDGVRLGIAFPVTDQWVHRLFWQTSYFLQFPQNSELLLPRWRAHPGDIARIRSDLVTAAIDMGCSHVLFMDTDQTYLDRDLAEILLSHDKPIVGGKVHRSWPPYEPILNRDGGHVPDEEIEAGGLVSVDTTGAGCLLIDLNVFFDIGKPWFHTTRTDDDKVIAGEDIDFCRRAKEAGYEIYVDCDVRIGHLTTLEVGQGIYNILKKVRGAT